MGQGIGDAACCPFAASILKDNFGPEVIGSAMGAYIQSDRSSDFDYAGVRSCGVSCDNGVLSHKQCLKMRAHGDI